VGDRVTALKDFRADLTAHLAQGLSAAAPSLGQLINPPAVIVESGDPYVTASDYCNDELLFEARVYAPPGDLAAVVDALDDMIDLVRSTLRTVSAGGHRYKFRGVSAYNPSPENSLPTVVVTAAIERAAP
jgi:hypothetical protein